MVIGSPAPLLLGGLHRVSRVSSTHHEIITKAQKLRRHLWPIEISHHHSIGFVSLVSPFFNLGSHYIVLTGLKLVMLLLLLPKC